MLQPAPAQTTNSMINDADQDQNADIELDLGVLPRNLLLSAFRVPLLCLLHVTLFSVIYAVAYLARFNFEVTDDRLTFIRSSLVPVVATKMFVFYFGNYFHGWWRYVTFCDLRALLKVSVASLVAVAFMDYFLLSLNEQIPRWSIILDAILTVLVIGGLRCTWRFVDEVGSSGKDAKSALLVVANEESGKLAAQINSGQSMPFRVVGLLASEPKYRRKAILGGVSVLGHLSGVVEVAKKARAKDLLILAGTVDGGLLRKVITKCNTAGITVSVLPRFENAMSGDEKIPLRSLNIDDLLKRDPVQLDTTQVETLIAGKRVLITGAGGSIGSEICRQIIGFAPAELILLGRGENRIYSIHQELEPAALTLGVILHREIGDITDESRMQDLFESRQPEIIFHAAAHKHVPLMELHPAEAVKNNVFGTSVIAKCADRCGASHFVMVSSDKAVNPTSIMGATKQLAERVVYDLAQISDTKFVTVRFGNVLGSAGSVIPYFQQQIRDGGPITITDERMTRYFMSIPEAAQLVVQSASMCQGGEIYVLDMGKPIKIVQLAEDLVSLSGLPKDSIEFRFTGIRPGEKLYEELYFGDEATAPTSHSKVRAAYARDFQGENATSQIDALIGLANQNAAGLKTAIEELVPSFHTPDTTERTVEPMVVAGQLGGT